MKREYVKQTPYIINNIKPYFFWKLCNVCKKEFKKEKGWEINIPWSNGRFLTYHACCSCLPTFEDAGEFAKKLMKPPPPPKRPELKGGMVLNDFESP